MIQEYLTDETIPFHERLEKLRVYLRSLSDADVLAQFDWLHDWLTANTSHIAEIVKR